MKKLSRVIPGALFIVSIFALAACGEGVTSQTVSFASGLRHTYENQQWIAVANSVKSGRTTRTVTLTEDNLSVFTVQSSTESGVLTLRITQGEETKEVDISNFNGNIDMGQFTAGKTAIELRYDQIQDMHTVIRWLVEVSA